MPALTRRTLLGGAAATALVAVTGCSDDLALPDLGGAEAEPSPEPPTLVRRTPTDSSSLSGDAAAAAAALSGLLLQSSRVAVLTGDEAAALGTAAELASAGQWPVLVGEAATPLPSQTLDELERLRVEYLVVVGEAPDAASQLAAQTGLEPDRVIVLPAAGPAVPPDGVPVGEPADGPPLALIVGASSSMDAAAASAAALGAVVHSEVTDPREESDVFEALRSEPALPLATAASEQSAAEALLVMGAMAQRAAELPGGGVTVFPHRRMVALYGHPGAPVLGLLGEQDVEASIVRVGTYVDRYQPLVEETVVPAFEIIASVATAGAGDDGNYSKVWPPEIFRAWVDAAKEAGVYVVLDLQPGRSDFLTQAREYEELLIEPHVGLALDPEWRLGPNERHLVRIGSVEAAEINQVSDYLAELVRTHDLPQKVLTLHQFRVSMIPDRDQVRTDHPELAIVLHADGQGSQPAKQDTWRVLKQDLPENMWLGWKNFYDEDAPMLTPEQTVAQVEPVPWFISYQ
ncbi:hypothetical protein GA707_08440 [Nostocoides sp. F2B08]|uniref:hypothetical protein n=1 Tax=Nostocoides sp. F2B08 TaxID=2653936 RepID=UPI001262E781|nr:hypothetical protein [Tetrasphaera sp. F2B08]KAB7744620.1 hypothetical protein GA707_08440 [Tetrasphaera sp. F2B08]